MVEWCFAGACVAWCVGIVVRQFRWPSAAFWVKWDTLWIFPSYNYFAPAPRFFDFILEYRMKLAGEADPTWVGFPVYLPKGRLRGLWNPQRFRMSLLHERMHTLLERTRQGRRSGLVSEAYRDLLEFCGYQAHGVAIQFRILTHEAAVIGGPSSVAFESDWHELP